MTIRTTPWGKPQGQKKIAYGITKVSTSSHGGLRLSAERMKVIEEKFPSLIPAAGACWLEEDEDCSFAVVVFPEFWSPREVAAAVKDMSSIYGGIYFEDMKASCQPAIAIAEAEGGSE